MTGLPALLVDELPTLQLGFKDAVSLSRRYDAKFITSTHNFLKTDIDESVASARNKDLIEKIKLFNAIKKMQGTRIMDVQVKGFGGEPHEHWWRLNQEEYLNELKQKMGMDVSIIDYRDVFKEYSNVDVFEAEKIAEKWIEDDTETEAGKNQRNQGDVRKDEIVNAAKLYIAADRMMKEEGCNALTMDASTWASPSGKEFAKTIGEDYIVSNSLALTEFRLHGIPVCCQSDMEGLVSQAVGEYVSGRPGLHGDFVIDPFNGVVMIGHCNAPINPYGDGQRFPYTIGGEQERRPQTYVDLPKEGDVTVIKTNVLENKLSVFTGEAVDGGSVYRNFTEAYCCTKLVVATNAEQIYENYDARTFGNHNCLFYGNFRDEIKEIGSLIGFSVIEQDR